MLDKRGADKRGREEAGQVGWFGRLLGQRQDEALPLYQAVVARARQPHWYTDGQVADTVDGRFDMIAAVLGFVLLRLEADPAAAVSSARLTERFVDDMDSQLRQIGIGDITVGKHIGRMMAMLGGRLGAYRDGLAGGLKSGDLDAALVRNLYRGEAPDPAALAHVRDALLTLRDSLKGATVPALIAGDLP